MRQKIGLILILLLLMTALLLNKKLAGMVSGVANQEPKEKVVVVDAGHGAEDPGKVGVNGVLEKDINLEVAKLLRDYLTAEGIQVVMTREDDQGLYPSEAGNKKLEDMRKRVEKINDTKPDLVVSVHQNSYSDADIWGAQVFYYTHSKDGKDAAETIQEVMKELNEENKRQAKANDTYYMLKKTEVPTVIVECGFLSHPEEADLLATKEYQKKVAEVIGNGVIKWLAK